MREIAELHDRDPEMFQLKANEMESGFSVMEAARALRLLGLSPQVVEIAPRLMPMALDRLANTDVQKA